VKNALILFLTKLSNLANPKKSASRVVDQPSNFIFDSEAGVLLDKQGRIVELRPQAMHVLHQLISNRGKPVLKETIVENVWNGTVVTDDSLVKAIGDIRKVLGDKKHDIVKTVHKRGYLIVDDQSIISQSNINKPTTNSNSKSNSSARLNKAATAMVVVVFTVSFAAFSIYYKSKDKMENNDSNLPIVAVLKFKAIRPQQSDSAFEEGFTEDLISELARSRQVRVISRHSGFAISTSGLGAGEISNMLGARYLIDGKVGILNEKLEVNLQLYDSVKNYIVGSFEFKSGPSELDDSRNVVIDKLSSIIQGGIQSNSKWQVLNRNTTDMDTYMLSLRVLARKHRYTAEDYLLGRKEAKTSLVSNPDYAPLWINLAFLDFIDAANLITGELGPENYKEIEATLQRGIDIDSSIPIAWHVKSLISGARGNASESLDAAIRATELAPNDPESLLYYARALLASGRVADARRNIELARFGYPIIPSYFHAYDSRIHWVEGNTEASLATADKCIAQHSKIAICWIQKIVTLYDAGRFKDAKKTGIAFLDIAPKANSRAFGRDFTGLDKFHSRRLAAAKFIGINVVSN